MIFNDMTSQYFDWLRETVCGRWEPRNLSFHKLLAFLFQQDFIPSCEMDASRAEDGRDLRYRFAQEKSIPYAALNSATSGMPCSILEMMVGLSIRIEEHIMADSEAGNRVGQWFWSMVVSLGLAAMMMFGSTRVALNLSSTVSIREPISRMELVGSLL